MNIFTLIEDRVRTTLAELQHEALLPKDCPLNGFVVEPPREAAHGDLATNVAMVLAKRAGQNPKELAAQIAKHLANTDDIEKAEVAGPGFINLSLKQTFWPKLLA